MVTVMDRQESLNTLDDLKALLSASGPCLSVYMPLSNASTAGKNPNAKQNELRWRECMQAAETQAGRFGDPGKGVIASVRNWAAVAPEPGGESKGHHGKSIAVFRSPEAFQVTLLDEVVPDQVAFDRQFQIRPLLKQLVRDRRFYLLALSQKNTRLLYCTTQTSEEAPFPGTTKTNFEDWMNMAKPDHRLVENAMSTGAQGSARPTALAPKGSDAEDKDEYLAHFLKHIATGVGEVLRGKTEPLVLCAVESYIPLYREVNAYPNLAPEAVLGAPNSLKSGEMHARAIEALGRCYDRKVEESLESWNHKVGGGGSSRLDEVVTAAHDGRVLTLMVSDSQEAKGHFDEGSHTVETGNEDLVNDAAVQTVLHAGKVLVVAQEKMPNGSPAAAIFRF
jgi:Bacterial archaeo-eukaryotic release factor family 3